MTTTQQSRHVDTRTQWAGGLVVFAAVTLTLTGLLGIFRGIMGIAQDDVFVTTPNYVFRFDLTTWGWIHLGLGVLALIVGLGLFQAATWARVLGVAIAGLVILSNFLSLPYFPLWSVVMIAMSGFIIWALCVTDRDEVLR